MSGVDNIRGIDYQITYSALRLLEILRDEADIIESVQFESITEKEEDMNIYKKDGSSEYIQIKKKSEGYSWTPSELREILGRFHVKDRDGIRFTFITDGAGNKDVTHLKKCLLNSRSIDNDLLNSFTDKTLTSTILKNLLNKVTILTHSYTSSDDTLPGAVVKEQVLNILCSASFSLSDSVENIYNILWAYIFKLSQECKTVKLEKIISDLKVSGLKLTNKVWFNIPDIGEFRGREDDINNVQKALFNIRKIIVKGISGIGKTLLMSKLAYNLNSRGKKVFWFELNNMSSISELLHSISHFLYNIGLVDESILLIRSEISNRIPRFIEILKRNEIYIFIDSVDKANVEIKNFIEGLYKNIINIKLKGSIAISIISDLEVYTDIDIISKKIFDYHLIGFTYEDTLKILTENNSTLSGEDIYSFYNIIGGYPISVVFLKQLTCNNQISSEEFLQLKKLSIENSNKWLFNKVFSILEKEEQDVALVTSIFNYNFSENEAEQIIKSKVRPKYFFDNLIKQNIILASKNNYYMHDSIRALLYDMLTDSSKKELHGTLARYYKNFMDKNYKELNEVLYDDIFKWGYHLENSNELNPICARLLDLSAEKLDALWAIKRFGFPFAFSDPRFEKTNKIVEFLLKDKLISKNHLKSLKYLYQTKKYVLQNFDFFDLCFLEHLCITRGISNHLGYICIFEPNEAYHMQGIACPWEHCIEHMPLPPMIKSEYLERIEYLKEMFEKGAYNDKPEEFQKMFLEEIEAGVPQDAPSEPDYELEKLECPIFGHCCPGGFERAVYCREQDTV